MDNVFKCRFCGQGFVREKAKESHERIIHVQTNNQKYYDDGTRNAFHCKKCGMAFPNLDMVEIHESKH